MTKHDTQPVSAADPVLALVLLTRLPLPRMSDAHFARQARAVWAYPLAGLAVGGLGWIAASVALGLGLSPASAAGLWLAATMLATGAMHEDGLADTADGLWGGTTAERRLEIMKDSRIGTYGVLALILSVLLRWSALTTLAATGAIGAALTAAIWSRALMPLLMAGLPNARGSGLSQSVGRPPASAWGIGLLLAAALGLPTAGGAFFPAAIVAASAALLVAAVARARIGGQTGDVLGSSQQLAEIACLLALAALA